MAPLSLKIIHDEGAVTRTVKFDSSTRVADALDILKEKVLTAHHGKDYGLFLTSADNERSGVWLESHRPLDYYMLRDGDSLLYLSRSRNLRVRMLDGSVKTLQVDESKNVGDLMRVICSKIGITNHDEYGLCHEETAEAEDSKEKDKPTTGTLTLKRKAQQRDRDAAMMDQLSKKFKTDDNVEWLDQHKTLREMGVDSSQTLLLKRKLFYSDRNVDSRDPVQLNLLYVQTRDAVLDARHPVTEDQAMEFAGIQCQIHFGDFNEEIHKPGLIENLNEYLPAQYSSVWGAEKKILKLFRKHQGLSALDAKFLYIKTARALPTYGVTFFLVKEKQKGKKKLVPRLLGINSESILRLDEQTKEILQVWPLTHIKTYHASSNETFMLNFGDYSDKEYCVKTNDAYRIREILEGYIDLIRRRMAAPWESNPSDSAAILNDHVEASQAHIISHVSNNPSKLVEHTFVGPSQIISYEPGKQSSKGTQIMTVQQLVINNHGNGATPQLTVSAAVPLRADMSPGFIKKLNRMNSNSVKVVTLLTDPTADNVTESKRIIVSMEGDMPDIIQGVRETADKQTSEEAKKRLLDQLKELMDLVDALKVAAQREHFNPEEAIDSARKIADLTTQMYFSMDPNTCKRGEIVRRSRRSFIVEERQERLSRRTSVVNAAQAASQAVDDAAGILAQECLPVVSGRSVDKLEAAAMDTMAKLSAAIAMYLTSLADPNNMDYEAAVTSMNNIKELMPQLATDAKAISSGRDEMGRQELLAEMEALCEAARRLCMLTGAEDHQIQEASNTYADVSGKLVYVIGRRNRRLNPDKENEIIDLSKEVGDKTTLLLVKATELTAVCEDDERAGAVDDAGVGCAHAARDLLLVAQLTAPTIHELHCQSALTASIEHLSYTGQLLASTWKPLVEDPSRHQLGDELSKCTLDLMKALERLRAAFGDLGEEDALMAEVEPSPLQARRLRFIASTDAARSALKNATGLLDEPGPLLDLPEQQVEQLQNSISTKMAQINAAVASLVCAHSDPNNPDYNTAELAMSTITELMPEVIKDISTVSSACGSEGARRALLDDVRYWGEAIDAVCCAAQHDDAQALDDAAKRFAKASKKLSFVFSPLANKAREQLLMELFNSAHNQALSLADKSSKMADAVGGASGARIRDQSQQVTSDAKAFKTALELTSPSLPEPRCQSTLLTRMEALAASAQLLMSEARGLQDDETGCRVLEAKLHQQRAQIQIQGDVLLDALKGIKETIADAQVVTQDIESPGQRVQRLKFITSTTAAKKRMKDAQDSLDQQIANPEALSQHEAQQLEARLGSNMAELNVALASLIQAHSDPKNSDYNVAEDAVKIISDIMPQVVNDTQTLSASCKDDAAKRAMIDDLRRWCDDIQAVCDSVALGDTREFVESAQRFVNSSNKLTFVVGPVKKSAKGQKVLQLTATASTKANQMVEDTEKASTDVAGLEGAKLQVKNTVLRDAIQTFNTTAQLTASSIEDPRCQSALLTSTNNLSTKAQDLVSESQDLQHPKGKDLSKSLTEKKQELDSALDGVRKICVAPPIPAKKPHLNTNKDSNLRQHTQQLLDHLREHESNDNTNQLIAAKNSEQQMQAQFAELAQETDFSISRAEEQLNKAYNAETSGPMLDAGQASAVRQRMEDKLALAGAAAAKLVASHHSDKVDYAVASESTQKLSQLMPEIVKDATALSRGGDKNSRRLLDEIRALCDATRRLCAAANQDHKKLTEAAVLFGDSSARLMYVVSEDVDPAQEKQVITLAKSIGDSASRLAAGGAQIATSAEPEIAQRICHTGKDAAEAAGTLVYTAKLVAPSIHHEECQQSLISSSKDLSTRLQAYQTSWKPLTHDPQHAQTVKEMDEEVDRLEKLLEEFREDLEKGRLVKRRERIVVEDTALRRLAASIMEDAKRRAESPLTSDDKRRSFAAFANQLAAAISELDVAHYRSKQAPHDMNKRQELENAVQNLQITLLQSRPSLADKPQNNIVDLTDFVKDVSSEAENLSVAANKMSVTQGKKILDEVIQDCHAINLGAFRLMNPEGDGERSSLDDILEVDHFANSCEARIGGMEVKIKSLEDQNARDALREKMIPLEENCNMLRFATKSALATAQSAALDAALDDLTDIQQQLDALLQPAEQNLSSVYLTSNYKSPSSHVSSTKLVEAVAGVSTGKPEKLCPALGDYITSLRADCHLEDSNQRQSLKEHLSKLISQLKTLTMTVSSRVAMWQPISCDDVTNLTQQVIEEIESQPTTMNTEEGREKLKVVSAKDFGRILMPAAGGVGGDSKQLEAKLQQTASQLSTLCGTLMTSTSRPEALARSARTMTDVAVTVANTAKTIAEQCQDPIEKRRIEEASQEMSWATYNLLKMAALASGEPKNAAARRRMLDACRMLNNAINKLARTVSPTNKTAAECSEIQRNLQSQLTSLQSSTPSGALNYTDTLEAVVAQKAMLEKLKSEERQPRSELTKTLSYISTSVSTSAQHASHAAYLLCMVEHDRHVANEGLVDVGRILNMTANVKDRCFRVVRLGDVEQIREEEPKLTEQLSELQQAVTESANRARGDLKQDLTEWNSQLGIQTTAFRTTVQDDGANIEQMRAKTITLLDSMGALNAILERPEAIPSVETASDEAKALGDELVSGAKILISKTQALVKEVKTKAPEDDNEPMTWVTFGSHTKGVLDAFESLLNSLKQNGQRAGLLAKEEEIEDDSPQKSFLQIQVETANKWLHRRPSNPDIQAEGEKAVGILIDIAEKMTEDLNGTEKEEMMQLISESKELFTECRKTYDNDNAGALMDRLGELRKAIERGVVSRLVDDCLAADEPLLDLEDIACSETDPARRKFLLERSIAELLAQLGRVSRTARLVAGVGRGGPDTSEEINKCTQQTELLAPQLVKAAQERVAHPDDVTVVENYRKLLAQYTESLARVRDLCDRSVDPMDFVQTAGEAMSRLKDDTSKVNDPQTCSYTSRAITRLANRVIKVSISSSNARKDPTLLAALTTAQEKLNAALPSPDVRASKLPDWKDTALVILRTTEEVESALGGEHIFVKQPEPDQPIYNAALTLHAAVRQWSGRDNDIVAAARRMAVLMARLADCMHTDKKRELLASSKSIVTESHEVSRLAKKLALECTDMRIRTNLLQVCERIPTISGQLKMLTTVKGSSFGQQGSEEDKEAMNMLVGNAQNLMTSVQEVVKAAVSATVKISASQRGLRIKWVRKQYH